MDKVIIEIVDDGKHQELGYRELNRLFNIIRARSEMFIKADFTEMYASVEAMEKGTLEIDISISPDILDRYDYIRQVITEGILWFLRTNRLRIADIPSPEAPFTHTVEPILDDVKLEYTIILHEGDDNL